MKFIPSLKSAKYLALVAATIATAIVSSVAPSQAHIPTVIMSTPGQPQLVVFSGRQKAYTIGCGTLRNVWSGIPTKEYPANVYQQVIKNFGGLAGELSCGTSSRVRGYISPAFGKNTGVIIADGKPSFVESGEFFRAMGITPSSLTLEQGRTLLGNNQPIYGNPTLEPVLASGTAIALPTPPPPAPAPPPPRIPTLAFFPASEVISAPGKPQVVIFAETKQYLSIGCDAVRNLWSGLSTKEVSLEQYDNMLNPKPNQPGLILTKGADLHCNAPNAVRGFTSPLFGNYAGVIITDGKPFFVASPEFFTAMGVKPVQLNDQQARDFLNRGRYSSTLLTTRQ